MAITTNNLISRQTVGSAGAATVTFSNIPQTFTDLRVVISSRVDYTGAWQNINIELNGDSGSNYTSKLLYGNGSAAGSDTSTTTFLKFVYSNFNTSTASVFSNGEMYFPNYRTATYKSVSSDSVTENNAATALTALTAGIWNDTAAITTIKFTPNQGSFGEFTTFSLYGISSNTSTQNTSVPSATGGDVITTDGTYWYHAFKYSGTFTPLKALTADCLVVAGGGSGSADGGGGGGGGGAGGLCYQTSRSFTTTNYTVTIGAGGAAQLSPLNGLNGSNSVLDSITALGGGYGSGAVVGGSGGSGGGTGYSSATNSGGAATQGNSGGATGYGNAGGARNNASGGGGGAGAVGSAGGTYPSEVAGAGGAGVNTYSTWASATVTGASGYYAGGGGGGYTTGGAGGAGGGGAGASYSNIGTAGTVNTGGGGGGTSYAGNALGAAGGSGIVIVRYAV